MSVYRVFQLGLQPNLLIVFRLVARKKILQCRLYFSWTRCGVQYNIKKCSLIELESLELLLNWQGTFSGEYDVVVKFEVERAKVAGKQVKL